VAKWTKAGLLGQIAVMKPGISEAPPAEAVTVALVALPETTPTSLYGFYELFDAVGRTWTAITGEPPAGRPMRPRIVAAGRAPFAGALGVPIAPEAAFDEVERVEVAIVTDLALDMATDPRGRWPEASAWLRRQHAAGATLCSVCTGSLLLAETGLLDGLEATTHWSATGLFARCYPAVRLRPERILSPAGPEHRLVTSGGATSWEELALYLTARFSGETEAIRIAKIFVLGDRSEGQLPYAARPRPKRHEDAVIADCQSWLADHYRTPHPVARLIARSGLPERSFKRRFRAATGYAPVDYVQTLRIEEAKQLLETTAEPTDSVAHLVGYEDPAFFRRLFKRRTGVTPARYRQRFRGLGRLPAEREAPSAH
jgi:transcriptional regulator GlxA family with amidase domain